jgi:hypothetical protein
MPVKTHVHRYVRAVGKLTEQNKDSGFVNYYKCADPDCSHYQKDFLVLGKRSICNRCGAEFLLPNALRMLVNKPHCKACTRVKGNQVHINIPVMSMAEILDVEDD